MHPSAPILAQSLCKQQRPIPLAQRHFYEIVWEGRPCHLYFDIEFCR
jgi:hypothetical protein